MNGIGNMLRPEGNGCRWPSRTSLFRSSWIRQCRFDDAILDWHNPNWTWSWYRRLRLFGSYSCIPGGNQCIHLGQTESILLKERLYTIGRPIYPHPPHVLWVIIFCWAQAKYLPVNSPYKWPVTRKIFHLMTSSWRVNTLLVSWVCFTNVSWALQSNLTNIYIMPEITFVVRISCWNIVRVPKAWLWHTYKSSAWNSHQKYNTKISRKYFGELMKR